MSQDNIDVDMKTLAIDDGGTKNDNGEKSNTTKSKRIEMDIPWLEKYRPRILDDVVGNEETISRLRVIAKHGNMPNLIISGPPGTGKTTSIHCLAYELLGEEGYKNAVLELNASDDRGIEVVRNKIKMFAQQKITLPLSRHKIIILDEADNMTSSAQQALRRTMELYSNTTRFALACNVSSKIIEPIQSRCAILRYTRLNDKQILARLLKILQAENIQSYTSQGLQEIVYIADGDMRNAINAMQATYAGFHSITDVNVQKVCDIPSPVEIKKVLGYCLQKDIRNAIKLLTGLLQKGYSTLDLISVIFRVVKSFEMDEKLKLNWIQNMAFTHARIADGLDTELQLKGLLAKLCLQTENDDQF